MNGLRYNICSISFRHELVSFRDLVRFARHTGFSGIELWGVHAKSLLARHSLDAARMVKEMQAAGMRVSMISDYVDLPVEPSQFSRTEENWRQLIALARLFETGKIRLFAGNKASRLATEREWELCAAQLGRLADASSAHGIDAVVETHPGTFADTLDSTVRVMRQTDCKSLQINLDFLHMWEAECEPLLAFRQLGPWVVNYHLKNVKNRNALSVFAPNNVYSPSGQKEGMVPLADGMVDYEPIVAALIRSQTPHSASIEWFGNDPHRVLKSELRWLRGLEKASAGFDPAAAGMKKERMSG